MHMNQRTTVFSRIDRLSVGVLLCLLAAASAWAQKDAALVTGSSGNVTWQAAGGRPQPVQSFMKLREGDRTEAAAGAKLTLVYLESGEVEQWDGPARFVVGSARTENAAAGKPATRKLPLSMVERIARTPEVMSDIRNRSGLTVTRSVGSPAATAARAAYASARAEAPADDITPELELFIVLYDERLYQQAERVLGDMQKRAPDDPAVAELVQRYRRALRAD